MLFCFEKSCISQLIGLQTVLRTELAVKERNLRVRSHTWVFDPVSWLQAYVEKHVLMVFGGINNLGAMGMIWDCKETPK